MQKVLITYYTKTNTTKEICEFISDEMQKKAENTEVISINEVKDLSKYDKIIVGAPINGMMWVNDAKDFVIKNSEILKTKKVGLFFNAYLIDNSYGFWNSKIKKSLDKYINLVNPISIGKFRGRVDKPFSGFPKLIFGCKSDAQLDRRNWVEIGKFIEKI